MSASPRRPPSPTSHPTKPSPTPTIRKGFLGRKKSQFTLTPSSSIDDLKFVGCLSVTLINGVDLAAKDKNGFSDPYVKITVLDPEKHSIFSHSRKTSIVKKSLNPEWNETFTYNLDYRVAKELKFDAWDYDIGPKDDFLGRAYFDLEGIEKATEPVVRELQLAPREKKHDTGIKGSIFVKVAFLSGTAVCGLESTCADLKGVQQGDTASLVREVNKRRETIVSPREGSFVADEDILSSHPYKRGHLDLTEDDLKEVYTGEFQASVTKVFTKLFADGAKITQLYHDKRQDKDLTIQMWDDSKRLLKFISPVNAPMGPKETHVEENQSYNLQKDKLIIEYKSDIKDIPYGNYFTVQAIWIFSELTSTSCKLSVYVGCHFTKSTFFKSKIDSGTIKETTTSVALFCQMAKAELEGGSSASPSSSLPAPSSSNGDAAATSKSVPTTETQVVQPPSPSASSSSSSSSSSSGLEIPMVAMLGFLLFLVLIQWWSLSSVHSELAELKELLVAQAANMAKGVVQKEEL